MIMKHQNQIIKIFMIVAAAIAPTIANPILSHKYTADPQPIVWNGRLYVYASNDDQSIVESDGYVIQAYTLVSTDDMVNWTDHGEVFRVPRDWNRGTATSARAYAPGAAVRNNMVYVYPCGAGGPVGVVTAPRPEGPFNDVHNGRAIADRDAWCRNCNVPWLFDPAAFIDDDGQAYLYWGGGNTTDSPGPGQNMRVAKLKDNMIELLDSNATTIIAPRSFEAAYMHKRGDIYYFSYVNNFNDDGDGQPNAAIMYMTGDNPMGPFTFGGPVLRNPAIGNTNINRHNNNHHAIIEYEGKWYMFYHDRRVGNALGGEAAGISVNQRNISVDSLVYNADGTMREVIVTEGGVAQIKNFNPYAMIGATTMNRQSGIRTDSVAGAGMILVDISDGDWVRLRGVDFGDGATKVIVRAASNSAAGGSIEFRTGSPTGTSIGTCEISGTGGWSTWQDFECDINQTASAGVKDFLYLVFRGTGEPFRLQRYTFEGSPIEPDENGFYFHHTFEDGTTQGWDGRGDAVVANTSAHMANGEHSLAVSGRTATWHGTESPLSTSIFVPDNAYSFSAIAMYDEGPETSVFKLTLSYTLDDEVVFAQVALATAQRGDWIMLENANFDIPVGASDLLLYVEMPDEDNPELAFFVDDIMGGIAGAEAPGREGVTSVRNRGVSARANVRPLISMRGKTLNVSSPTNNELRVRLIDVRGRVRAEFMTSGNVGVERFSLRRIPAGAYFVDVRGVDVRQVSTIMVR